jgi:hypothetical protein
VTNPVPGAFQQVKDQTEQQVVLRLLSALDKNPETSQRKLASDLGIALGLMNTYLKKCVVKGWVRATQVSAKRIGYFLTPDGFAEKSHMVKDYLARSFSFFQHARIQCNDIFTVCKSQGFQKISLVGEGDLKEIAILVSSAYDLEIANDINKADAVVITDVMNPQKVFDDVVQKFDVNKVFTPDVLHISRNFLRG